MELTLDILIQEAKYFSEIISIQNHISLIGITDGKAVGTYVEHLFQEYLHSKYVMTVGSSALGIDLPSVNTDIKTTSYAQPQSSCPFKSARQKFLDWGITCSYLFTISMILSIPVLLKSHIVPLSRQIERQIIPSLHSSEKCFLSMQTKKTSLPF